MELAVFREPLDRHNVRAVRLRRKHRARFHRAAVHVNGAAAALARIATDVRAREPEHVANEIREQRAVFDFTRVLRAIYRDFDLGHCYLPAISATARFASTRTRFAGFSREPWMSSFSSSAASSSPWSESTANFFESAASATLHRNTPGPAPVTATRMPLAVSATKTPVIA